MYIVPKVGKDDYNIAKSYRPISLMNYLLKGLERLSVWVADTALDDNPLHIKQHGFQKGKSTETAISVSYTHLTLPTTPYV